MPVKEKKRKTEDSDTAQPITEEKKEKSKKGDKKISKDENSEVKINENDTTVQETGEVKKSKKRSKNTEATETEKAEEPTEVPKKRAKISESTETIEIPAEKDDTPQGDVDESQDPQEPKPKRVRPVRGKAKKKRDAVAICVDARKLLCAALSKVIPGLIGLEIHSNWRSAFGVFDTPEHAEEAIKLGSAMIVEQNITIERSGKGGVFIAVNGPILLTELLRTKLPGLITVGWSATYKHAYVRFDKQDNRLQAIQKKSITIAGQEIEITDELYEVLLPDVGGTEILFQLISKQFPGLENVEWLRGQDRGMAKFISDQLANESKSKGPQIVENTYVKVQ